MQRKLTAALAFSLLTAATAQQPPTVAEVARTFAAPPGDARPMMRWWWFGPAVVKPELEREILAMKAGGIGGFEIQPVYAMALDDAATGFRNLPYLSNEFLDAVSFAAKAAQTNGMRVDMTLASGWPYGGRHVPVDQAAARLRVVAIDLPAQAKSLAMPAMGDGESLIAAFTGNGSAKSYTAESLKQFAVEPHNGRTAIPEAATSRVAVFYLAGRTGQQVKRAAVDADGFVLDHFSKTAVDTHLKVVGEPLMKAFGASPPYAVFSDSLEVYSADWTDDLLPEFKRRRGYDLLPLLPQLVSGAGEVAAQVRHDWGVTLTELIDERYLTPINNWASAHGTRFRSQTYGAPAVTLSSNNLVALPEGEGPQWNQFSYTRWATSASHLYHRNITSAETWTWLHSPAFRATPLDMKAEADRFFLEGVNQLIGHGWPYTPPGVAEPGWSFYAAAVFNDHNPWWIVMPDVMHYLQRMSYLLRQGEPANDIAVLLPEDDAYADFMPGEVSLSAIMPKWITPTLTEQILSAGYGFDYVDPESIQKLGIHAKVLVLPHVQRLSPATMAAIAAFVEHGGKVIAVGSKPDRAPGFLDAAKRTAEVNELSNKLFAAKGAELISSDEALGAALTQATAPDLNSTAPELGFIHRKLADSDIYFVVNTSNHPLSTTATFRDAHRFAAELNPFTGAQTAAPTGPIHLQLAPYESRALIFSDSSISHVSSPPAGPAKQIADLSRDWSVHFDAPQAHDRQMATLQSWTADDATRFFSGTAIYSRTVQLSASQLTGQLLLDFGPGTPVEANPAIKSGVRALLESPIREAAVVTINGQPAGSVWHPPYRLDITGKLHAGENRIEIRVANTAINLLAGRTPPDYKLLSARYGKRFDPQDMDNLQPLPSGILGPVTLMEISK